MRTDFEACCTSDPQPAEGQITGSMALATPLEPSSAGGHAVAPGAEHSAPAANEKCCAYCDLRRTAALEAEIATLRLALATKDKRIDALAIERDYHVGVIADCIDKLNPKGASPCLN